MPDDLYARSYPYQTKAKITCVTNYIVSWAAADTDNSGDIVCGVDDMFVPDGKPDAGEAGCVGKSFLLLFT